MLISPPTDFFFLFSSETQVWFCMILNLKLIRLLTILQHEILISTIHPLPLFFTKVIHSSRPNSRLIFLMSKQSFQSVLIFSFLHLGLFLTGSNRKLDYNKKGLFLLTNKMLKGRQSSNSRNPLGSTLHLSNAPSSAGVCFLRLI